MASTIMKNKCAKCDKGAGTAICYGCEQTFCTKHFIEHRQDLSQQMDNVGQEHDVLCGDMNHKQKPHPLLARINQWEQESIIKIQTAANLARSDLQQLLDKAKNNLTTFVSKMTNELQSSRESDDYTELDIKKWTDQLEEYRKMLTSPTTAKIDYESDIQSAVRLIKMSEQQSFNSSYQASEPLEFCSRTYSNLNRSSRERFDSIFGKIALSERGLTATCLDDYDTKSWVDGMSRYSSGIHYIRFRMEVANKEYYTFLGIINALQKMPEDMKIWKSKSCHGWWDLGYTISDGVEQDESSSTTVQTGDDVTPMLDCEDRRIQLKHHRTNRVGDISVNLRLCPFPWKIIVVLRQKDDCVRILQ